MTWSAYHDVSQGSDEFDCVSARRQVHGIVRTRKAEADPYLVLLGPVPYVKHWGVKLCQWLDVWTQWVTLTFDLVFRSAIC